jgi:hypothetical protein
MDILHFLNVLIGFSLVILLLSLVTGSIAQACLVLLRTKTRAVGKGLVSMMEDIGPSTKKDVDSSTEEDNAGSDKNKNFSAKHTVNTLLDKGSSISEGKDEGVLSKFSAPFRYAGVVGSGISQYFLAGAPKYVSREEFLLLLLRKAKLDNDLAKYLGFENKDDANVKLEDLEKKMVEEEANDSKLPAQVWRTIAMNKTVQELAAKIFSRFDEVMDRVAEKVSADGKKLGIIITVPLLLMVWPVDAMDLFNRLYNNPVLSAKLAAIAEANISNLNKAEKELQDCQNKETSESSECTDKEQEKDRLAKSLLADPSLVEGLFGKKVKDMEEKRVYNLSALLMSNKSELNHLKTEIDKAKIELDACQNKSSNSNDSKACESEKKKKEELDKRHIEISDLDLKIVKPTPGMFVTLILVSLGSAFWLGVLNKILGIRSEFSNKLDEQKEVRAAKS